MNNPTLEYDDEANALYLRFSQATVENTIVLSDSVYVDIDVNGDPIGIEILHATPAQLPNAEMLDQAVTLRELLKSEAA